MSTIGQVSWAQGSGAGTRMFATKTRVRTIPLPRPIGLSLPRAGEAGRTALWTRCAANDQGHGYLRGRTALRLRPLLKDPFAVFSLAWFVHRLHCQVVVTVRHPAAFVGSLKRLNWSFDFQDLLQQPLLMRDHLEPYRVAMKSQAADDVVGQASLLWAMIYHCLHVMRARLPSVLLVRHEDLSLHPTEGFENLYKALGLDFSPRAQRLVIQSSSSANPDQLSVGRVHSVQLDSRANLGNWKRRLDAEEISRIAR